jgi:hypothetical protein
MRNRSQAVKVTRRTSFVALLAKRPETSLRVISAWPTLRHEQALPIRKARHEKRFGRNLARNA